MKRADEYTLCWNVGTDQVALVPYPDYKGLSDPYDRTGLAGYSHMRNKSFAYRKLHVFIEAVHLIVRDGCDPQAVHKALLGLEEYQSGLSSDMPGNIDPDCPWF